MRIINLCFIEHIQLKKQLNVFKNIIFDYVKAKSRY